MYAKLAYRDESIEHAEAGTITLPDAPDCVVARIEPHAVQLASGDHRYDLDHDLGRLFAAAPDLLAALQRLVDLDSGTATDTAQDWDAAIAAACAVIAQAEGR